MTIDRDEKGRKIHKRKTMAELERDFTCPYDSCGKGTVYPVWKERRPLCGKER